MVVVAVALDHITPPCGWLCSCNNMPPRVLFLTKQTEICIYNPTWLIFFFFFFFNFIREGTASEQHWLSDRIWKNSKVCGEHWIELCFQINTEERWALICEISYLWACVAKRRSEAQSDDLHGNSLLIKRTWSHGEKHTLLIHAFIYILMHTYSFL